MDFSLVYQASTCNLHLSGLVVAFFLASQHMCQYRLLFTRCSFTCINSQKKLPWADRHHPKSARSLLVTQTNSIDYVNPETATLFICAQHRGSSAPSENIISLDVNNTMAYYTRHPSVMGSTCKFKLRIYLLNLARIIKIA